MYPFARDDQNTPTDFSDDLWSSSGVLAPVDLAAGDQFGFSVGVSEQTAIVAAPFADDAGSDAGVIYLFRRRDLAGTPADPTDDTWQGQERTTALDGAANDWFGYSVDISDSHAIVGSILDDDQGMESGSAYIEHMACSDSCAGDLDENGAVSFTDLLVVLGNWSQDPATHDGDVNEDGAIDFNDLVLLLSLWGPC